MRHLAWLSWPLAVMTVAVFRSRALEQPTAVHALDDLAHEALELHLVDRSVCFPHRSPLAPDVVVVAVAVAPVPYGLYTRSITNTDPAC